MINPALREANPKYAEFLEGLLERYERTFQVQKKSDGADCYEGIREFGKLIVQSSSMATISVTVGGDGITRLVVEAVPIAAK